MMAVKGVFFCAEHRESLFLLGWTADRLRPTSKLQSDADYRTVSLFWVCWMFSHPKSAGKRAERTHRAPGDDPRSTQAKIRIPDALQKKTHHMLRLQPS